MLSIRGMLGAESPVRPKRSEPGGGEQPLSPKCSSPESQIMREREREERERRREMGRDKGTDGDSPRDRRGVGALLAAMASERTPASEEYPTGGPASQPPSPLPPPHSAESTPGPQRKRKSAEISSGSTFQQPSTKQKRAPRPQYTKEQEDFIWFCRDDLSMSWRKVVELYNDYWHPFENEPHIRSESGLQSRYYRILDFPVKIRKKKEPSRPDLGLIPSTNRRYPWMGVLKERRVRESGADSGAVGVVGRSVNMDRRTLSSDGGGGGGGARITIVSEDGRIEPDHSDDDDSAQSTLSATTPSVSDIEYPTIISQSPHHHHHHQQQQHLRPSHLLTNMDHSVVPDGYESSWTASPSSSPNADQNLFRPAYPRPPDHLAPLGALLDCIRTPKSSGHVRAPRGIRIRQRERLAGPGTGEVGREKERERVDARLSVNSLCV